MRLAYSIHKRTTLLHLKQVEAKMGKEKSYSTIRKKAGDTIYDGSLGSLTILQYLGSGKSGHSYLAENENGRFVFKQIHHENCPFYSFGDKLAAELHAYESLTKAELPVPKLISWDTKQEYLIKEYIEGSLCTDLVISESLEDTVISELFALFTKARSHGFNLDYFPDNFVLSSHLCYIDFEINTYSDEWNLPEWGLYYWANGAGMKAYRESGDITKINKDRDSGKPLRDGLDPIVRSWISRFSGYKKGMHA